MKIKTIFGRDIIIPFLGWTRVSNFENINFKKREEIKEYLYEIENLLKKQSGETKRLDIVIKKLRMLSLCMLKSEDTTLRTFGSQIKMTASVPEIVRSSLLGEVKKDVIEATTRIKVESIDENDYLRGFYLNSLLFKSFIESAKGTPKIQVNRKEFAKEIINAGKSLEKDYKSINPIYNIFVKYCNKQMIGIEEMPEICFIVNYLNRILIEVLYDSGAYIPDKKYKEFCKSYGKNCTEIGKGMINQDRMHIASIILDLYQNAEKLSSEIYAS